MSEMDPTAKCDHLINVLRSGGDGPAYPSRAVLLNTLAKHEATRDAFLHLSRRVHKLAFRSLLGRLPAAQWQVYCAILTRTFGFGKIAEAITYEQMSSGLKDKDGIGLMGDDDGIDVFAGCGLKSPKDIGKAFSSLLDRGFISRLQYREGGVGHCIYTPVPLWLIHYEVLGPAIRATQDEKRVILRNQLSQCFAQATDGFSPGLERWCSARGDFIMLVDQQNSSAMLGQKVGR